MFKAKTLPANRLRFAIVAVTALAGCDNDARNNDRIGVATVDGLATPGRPVQSPSGRFELVVVKGRDGGGEYWKVEVHEIDEGNRKLTARFDEAFYISHATFILWDQYDRAWIYSGDLGTYVCSPDPEGVWSMTSYVKLKNKGLRPPELLLKLRPKLGER